MIRSLLVLHPHAVCRHFFTNFQDGVFARDTVFYRSCMDLVDRGWIKEGSSLGGKKEGKGWSLMPRVLFLNCQGILCTRLLSLFF